MKKKPRNESAKLLSRELEVLICKRDSALALRMPALRRGSQASNPASMVDKIYRMEKTVRDQDIKDINLIHKLKSASVTARDILKEEFGQFQDSPGTTLRFQDCSFRRRSQAAMNSPRSPGRSLHNSCKSTPSSPRTFSSKVSQLNIERWKILQERCEEVSKSQLYVRKDLHTRQKRTSQQLGHLLETSQRLSDLSHIKTSLLPELYSMKKYAQQDRKIDALRAVWEFHDILV